jgi:hypothetical protein
MSSLSSAITRHPSRTIRTHRSPVSARPHPVRALAVDSLAESADDSFENLKLFATGWVAGLIFFGTFLA